MESSYGGHTMGSFLMDHGMTDGDDLRKICVSLRRQVQRAHKLLAHNDRTHATLAHVAASACTMRTVCAQCADKAV